jgi:protein ImuB
MFACIYIPDFPAEAVVRAEPLLRERPVAVLEGNPPLTRVIALNEKARLLGMEIGMTKLQAAVYTDVSLVPQRGSSPNLAILRQRSPHQENSAHAALLDMAHAFTPRVEDTAADTISLDLAGLERLYGAPARMASDLASRVTALGMEVNIAIAANPDAAMHAARGFNGTTVIPAGSEAQRLGVLPLQVLLDAFELSSPKNAAQKASQREPQKLREPMLDTLERWGVRDLRTLALLPEHALASRLGDAGVQLRRLARGEGMRTLVLCRPSAQFVEAMELESPVETIESLSFVLNRLLEQLCARLEARALAAQELRLRLQLERRVADEETITLQELAGSSRNSHNVGGDMRDKPIFQRTLRLPVSMRDAKVFLKLLQLELAAHPPGAPVTKLWITAQPAPPRSAQHGLFLPVTPEAERLEITLARISALVGERRAGIARLLDSYRRERFSVERFTVTAGKIDPLPSPTMGDTKDNPPLAMRLYRPPYRLQVGLTDGRPETLIAETNQTHGQLRGKVVWSAGPWRSSGDWWTENTQPAEADNVGAPHSGAWDREEWDIALAHPGENSTNDANENDGNENNGNESNGGDNGVALYRIYRDLATNHWFADASYD